MWIRNSCFEYIPQKIKRLKNYLYIYVHLQYLKHGSKPSKYPSAVACYLMNKTWGHYLNLNKISPKDKYCVILLLWIFRNKLIRTESRILLGRSWEGRWLMVSYCLMIIKFHYYKIKSVWLHSDVNVFNVPEPFI